MVLLTDDCDDSKEKDRQEKAMELVLSGNTLNVFFRFSNGTQTPSCQVTPVSRPRHVLSVVSEFRSCVEVEVAVLGSRS